MTFDGRPPASSRHASMSYFCVAGELAEWQGLPTVKLRALRFGSFLLLSCAPLASGACGSSTTSSGEQTDGGPEFDGSASSSGSGSSSGGSHDGSTSSGGDGSTTGDGGLPIDGSTGHPAKCAYTFT